MIRVGLYPTFAQKLSLLLSAATLVSASSLPCFAQTEDKPVVAVSIAPLSRTMEDISYVMRAVGAGQYSGMAKTIVQSYTGGIDENRAAGALVYFEDDQPVVVGFLPLEDREQFFEPLKLFGPIEDLGDGIYAMALGPRSIYASEVGKWLFIAQEEEHFAYVPKDPSAVVAKLADRYDIGLRLNIAEIPASLTDMLLAQLESSFDAGMQAQDPDLSEEELRKREAMGKLQIAQLEKMLKETENVVVGWGVDQSAKKTFIDSGTEFVVGSNSDQQVEAMQKLSSQFLAFEQSEAPVRLRTTLAIRPEDAESMLPTIKSAFESILEQAQNASDDKPVGIDVLKKFLDAQESQIIATLKEGTLDGGMLMQTEAGIQMVVGTRVADGNAVADSVQKLMAEVGSAPNAPKIKFNASTHAGVTLHTGSATLPPDAPKDLRNYFGDSIPFVVGTAPKAIYFALGKDSETSLKKFLDANSKAKANGKVDPGHGHVDLIPILRMVKQMSPNSMVDIILTKLEENPSLDSIILDSKLVPHGIVYRMTLEEGLLKAIGAGAQAGGAGGPGF